MGRATVKRGKGKRGGKTRESHALPLHETLDDDLAMQRREEARQRLRAAAGKKRKSRGEEEEDRGEDKQVLEGDLTAKILRQARKQQQEIARELERESGLEATRQAFDMAAAVVAAAGATNPALKSQSQSQSDPNQAERPALGQPEGVPRGEWGSEDEDEDGDEGEEGRGHLPRGWGAGAGATKASGAGTGSGAGRKREGGEGRGEEEEGHGEESEEVPWQSLGGGTSREGGGAEEGDDTIRAPGDFLEASQYDDELGVEVTEEDERAIALFLAPPSEAPRQRTLADVIREKIAEHTKNESEAASRDAGGIPAMEPEMRSKVQAVYRGVGQLLSRYTAGQVPKAFKLIPALSNWEEVLQLTYPETWTAPAMFAATRLFASNLNARMAQRFFRLVLLPRLRRDIREHKRLHFALYQSLKKALYKPSAFFKGILLPICQSRTCSLREAVIIGSVIQKVSIPVLHSSVALMRIAEMPYAGTNSYFMKLFFDKKYALPYRVLDSVVEHFVRFKDEERVLPVIWHQSLLSFVQRYKEELTIEQKGALRALVAKKHHYLMSPEILRELNSSNRLRGQKFEPGAGPGAGSGRTAKGAGEWGEGRAKRQKMDVDEMATLPQVHIGMDED